MINLSETDLRQLVTGEKAGVVLVNPGRGKNLHQTFNQPFLEFLMEQPEFMLFYMIPNNNNRRSRVRLRSACKAILESFSKMNETTYLFQCIPA
jgi:hypothetical protein